MGKQNQNWDSTIGSTSGVNVSGVLNSGVAQSTIRNWLISSKPSISNQAEFEMIYQAANPVNDPNFTVPSGKCYHSAPNESWDARTRNYTYNVEWTYNRNV